MPQMKSLAIAVLLAACSSKQLPAAPAKAEQPATLSSAVTYLCDAPTRTKADPKYKAGCLDPGATCPDADGQVQLLGEHMKENQTNERVLAFLNVEGNQKGPALDKLMQDAGVTQCALHDIYK